MTAGKVLNGGINHTEYKTIACSNKKKTGSLPSLPEEIVFNILVWLPANDLYNSMRYVCWQWYSIIHDPFFIKEHLLRSTTGFFIQNNEALHGFQFAEFGKMSAAVTEVSLRFPGMVLASCNGLLLFLGKYSCRTVHVANPLTKQSITLPSLSCPPFRIFSFSLACVNSKREHKVVCTYRSDGDKELNCVMITLGKDLAWKLIHREKLSDLNREMFLHSPCSTAEFIYWACGSFSYIVALDVESEMFYEFPSPAISSRGNYPTYLRRGKPLSCMVRYGPGPGRLVDIWVLSDPMSGEWKKLYKFDMDAQKRRLSRLFKGLYSRSGVGTRFYPLDWVNNSDVLVFFVVRKSGPYVAFNVKTGKAFAFGNCEDEPICSWFDFSYSLVSLTPS